MEDSSNATWGAAQELEFRVLVLAPTGADVLATSEVLASAGIAGAIYMDMANLCREIRFGAGAVLLTDESIKDENAMVVLSAVVGSQPKWSDLPLVLLASGGAKSQIAIDALRMLPNVLVLDRPVHLSTLFNVLRTALRGRQRQYEIRNHLDELKRAHDALLQAKGAAEAATLAKSRFLANVSHELRTPMNAILGMIDVILPMQTDSIAKDFLSAARESADLLLALLNDLLDSAKIESGNMELEAAPMSLRRILDQLTRILTVRACGKGLAFHCQIPEDLPDAVIGDNVRLRQVLLNLAGNAIKFTARGDVAVIVQVEVVDGQGHFQFTVRDTGIGIPAGDLERIFSPFAQADASTARKFGGTGLGLSISKNLVEMMGGRIWAESVPGKGSEFNFTVCLPLSTDSPKDDSARQVPGAPVNPLRLLLVEDNPANQKLVAFILKERGHAIDVAGDGHEALRLATAYRYDAILMDLQMPGMDGLEATAALRALESGGSHRVPIIAMTAHAMAGDRERFLALGMDGYLSKPIDACQMLALIERSARGAAPAARDSVAFVEPVSPTSSAVFDFQSALNRCAGSQELLAQMAQCFLDEVSELIPQMLAAAEKGNLAELGRLGHRLIGTLVYLGAERTTAAARRVERLEGEGQLADAEKAIKSLDQECEALRKVLTGYWPTTCAPHNA